MVDLLVLAVYFITHRIKDMKVPVYYDGGDQNLFQDELNQNMRSDLSDEGWVTPSQDTAAITDLAPDKPDGTHWYDSATHEVKWKINGVVTVMATV